MPVVHEFDPPERFVAGTVGEPGGRTFFLQARSGPRLVSVALEKQQVAVLAERIDELLDEVMSSSGTETLIPAVAPVGLEDSGPLEQPIDEQFRAGTMTLSWDPDIARLVIEVFPLTDTSDEDDEDEVDEVEPDEVFPGPARGRPRSCLRAAGRAGDRGRPSRLSLLRQPDRPRGPSLRAGERVPPPRPGLNDR